MSKIRLFRLFSCLVFLGASSLTAEASPSFSVIIHEVQITGGTGRSDDDFIELYNPSTEAVDISGYQLHTKNSNGTLNSFPKFPEKTCINPSGYYLWSNKKGAFQDIGNLTSSDALAAKYSLALFDAAGTILDSVSWGGAPHRFTESAFASLSNPGANQSLQRDTATGKWSSAFSQPSTPIKGEACVFTREPTLPSSPLLSRIQLNEILPRPQKGSEEFIELYNHGPESVNLKDWLLTDASKTGKYVFPETSLEPGSYLVIPKFLFKFALNDSRETLSLWNPAGQRVDQLTYSKSRPGVSLNRAEPAWRGGTPTPGAANQLNDLPITREKVPKRGYRDIPVIFDARGKDPEKQALKYVWDFGDGHKSYKGETKHTYKKTGRYTVTLTTQDDKDEVVETFSLEIEKYRPPKLRITALIPNPAGKDTEGEWIKIENRGKKRVNLSGWSLATGSSSKKKLVNHPIKEDMWIGPGETRQVTREHSLITLPNQKGRIELRAPNGEVVDKVKYRSERSIPEGQVYQEGSSKEWVWQTDRASVSPATDEGEEATVEKEEENALPPAVLGMSTEAEIALQNRLALLFIPERFDDLPSFEPTAESYLLSQKKDPAWFLGSFHMFINRSLNHWFQPTE